MKRHFVVALVTFIVIFLLTIGSVGVVSYFGLPVDWAIALKYTLRFATIVTLIAFALSYLIIMANKHLEKQNESFDIGDKSG